MRRLVMVAAMMLVAFPVMGQGYHRGHGGYGGYHGAPHGSGGNWVGPALGGMALGAIVGGIIAQQQQPVYAAPPPAYYAPPPPVIYQTVPAYAPQICRMVPVDVLPNGSTVFRQECRD
jgi:hypothetical protein